MKHTDATESLFVVRVMTPHRTKALNVARARANRYRIQALLANGNIDAVEREMLEEEEAAMEAIINEARGGV